MRFALAIALLVMGSSQAAEPAFRLSSPDLAAGQPMALKQVYRGFGCSGDNVSPALSWQGAPAGTKSSALLGHEPDAPTGSGWGHWVGWNIPAGTSTLPAGSGDPAAGLMPAGAVQGNTDFGAAGYGGPCPPPGSKPHHYHFRLYALKVDRLDLPPNATAAFVSFNVRANALADAELVATYAR